MAPPRPYPYGEIEVKLAAPCTRRCRRVKESYEKRRGAHKGLRATRGRRRHLRQPQGEAASRARPSSSFLTRRRACRRRAGGAAAAYGQGGRPARRRERVLGGVHVRERRRTTSAASAASAASPFVGAIRRARGGAATSVSTLRRAAPRRAVGLGGARAALADRRPRRRAIGCRSPRAAASFSGGNSPSLPLPALLLPLPLLPPAAPSRRADAASSGASSAGLRSGRYAPRPTQPPPQRPSQQQQQQQQQQQLLIRRRRPRASTSAAAVRAPYPRRRRGRRGRGERRTNEPRSRVRPSLVSLVSRPFFFFRLLLRDSGGGGDVSACVGVRGGGVRLPRRSPRPRAGPRRRGTRASVRRPSRRRRRRRPSSSGVHGTGPRRRSEVGIMEDRPSAVGEGERRARDEGLAPSARRARGSLAMDPSSTRAGGRPRRLSPPGIRHRAGRSARRYPLQPRRASRGLGRRLGARTGAAAGAARRAARAARRSRQRRSIASGREGDGRSHRRPGTHRDSRLFASLLFTRARGKIRVLKATPPSRPGGCRPSLAGGGRDARACAPR